MTDAEVVAYLEEQKVLNVATIGPTGHPHVVAMWYIVIDGAPAFWTFAALATGVFAGAYTSLAAVPLPR